MTEKIYRPNKCPRGFRLIREDHPFATHGGPKYRWSLITPTWPPNTMAISRTGVITDSKGNSTEVAAINAAIALSHLADKESSRYPDTLWIYEKAKEAIEEFSSKEGV